MINNRNPDVFASDKQQPKYQAQNKNTDKTTRGKISYQSMGLIPNWQMNTQKE